MKVTNYNDTLSALFCAAFGIETLRRGVFNTTTKVTREEAVLAIGAGLIAADRELTFAQANAARTTLIDTMALIMGKPKHNPAKKDTRTDYEQKVFKRAQSQYLYYFGTGASSKGSKGSNSTDKKADIKASATRAIKRYTKAELRAYIALLQAAL